MENEIFTEKLQLAQENFDAGNFNNAIAYCKQAVSYSPKNLCQSRKPQELQRRFSCERRAGLSA